MYNLPHHKEHDDQVIADFIARYPFAFVTACGTDHKPIATQLPVFIEEIEGKKVLRGHIMSGTDHHKAFLQNSSVLVVFTGHHAYVSGTWYNNPNYPSTWNYMSVHIKGTLRFLDEAGLEDVLRLTTLHFENHDRESTTVFDNLPADFKQRAMKMIAAFEIEILELDTVFKLSQDRDYQSYLHIIEKLKQQGESGQVIAAEMEKRTSQVFSDALAK
jgi:transcriptional regulator